MAGKKLVDTGKAVSEAEAKAKKEAEAKAKKEAEAKAKKEAEAKTAKINIDGEEVVATDLSSKEEIIERSDNFTAKQLEERATDIKNLSTEYKKQFSALQVDDVEQTKALQSEYINQLVETLGIDRALIEPYVAGDANWTPSSIIQELGIYVIEQQHKKGSLVYNETIRNLVPNILQSNGSVQKIYTDFKPADEVSGYADVNANVDLNQGTNLRTYEVFYANKEIHKGYDLLSDLLNDITRDIFLFVAIMKNLQDNVMQPVDIVLYRYMLQLIANPFSALSITGIDVSAVEPDITITATDEEDAMMKFDSIYADLQTSSRKNTPNNNWLPSNFDTDIITNPKFTKILIPRELNSRIKYKLKAGTFQLDSLDIPEKIESISYEKTFSEFGLITGLKYTDNVYDIFLVEAGAVEMITHYQAGKLVATPKLKDVYNLYVRTGSAINKDKRIFKIRMSIGAE